jgi:hypothetical protein
MAGGMQGELNSRLLARLPSHSNCAVDGLRHPLDYEALGRAFSPHFYLLYVDTALETRWHRVQARYPTLDYFREVEAKPVEQHIPGLAARAFTVLRNEASLQELHAKVNEVLLDIRNEKNI